MQSMPKALLWETLMQGRWSLPAFFMLGNAMPLLVYGSLSGLMINAEDPSYVVLQFAFVPLVIFQFAIGIVFAQGPMSRLYALPISTHSIVAWHTISGAIILAIETVLAALLYNKMFHVEWPIFGAALFAVAAWSAFQNLLCMSSRQSISGFFVASLPGIALGIWIRSRYGAFFSPPMHYWQVITGAEIATLMIATGLFYAMTVFGVQYARCGEHIPTLGVGKWLARQWELLSSQRPERRRFQSAAEAQAAVFVD